MSTYLLIFGILFPFMCLDSEIIAQVNLNRIKLVLFYRINFHQGIMHIKIGNKKLKYDTPEHFHKK